jgi:O-antigen/teichoic acid export membrane protein
VAFPAHVPPRFRDARIIATRLRVTAIQLWGDFVISQGAVQAVILAIPLVAPLELLGALKAAQVAFGPVSNALNAAMLMAIPATSARARASRFGEARSLNVRLGIAGLAIAAVYTAVLIVLPRGIGDRLFGATWPHAAHLLLFVGAQYGLMLAGVAALVVLRATRLTSVILRARTWITPTTIGLPLVGAAVAGSRGLGLGLVCSAFLNAAMWWFCAWRAIAGLEAAKMDMPDAASAKTVDPSGDETPSTDAIIAKASD